MNRKKHSPTSKESCIELMIFAETHNDEELKGCFEWLGKEAIKDNVSIYDKYKEVLIKHKDLQRSKQKNE